MKQVNPDHVQALGRIIETSPFPALLSMKLRNMGKGFADFEIDIAPKHLQLHGVVHGGVHASLIDTAAFWAVYYGTAAPEIWYTSVDLKVNYLGPAKSGMLLATGREIKVGKNLCYAEARILDGKGKIIAHGTSTLMLLPKAKLPFDVNLPPKYRNTQP